MVKMDAQENRIGTPQSLLANRPRKLPGGRAAGWAPLTRRRAHPAADAAGSPTRRLTPPVRQDRHNPFEM
jgi:hypothetical protein